jgi:superoxide reductase
MKKILEEVIEEYNKYHSPEAIAKLVSIEERSFIIKFTGSFCQSCGFYDYFDDYKILLEEHGLKSDITGITEIEEGAKVKFKV